MCMCVCVRVHACVCVCVVIMWRVQGSMSCTRVSMSEMSVMMAAGETA